MARLKGQLAHSVRALPRAPGVYRFRDADDTVLYVGRAAELRGRVASYWSDLRDRSHLTPMVAAVARVEAVLCGSRHEAAWLERNLLEVALPPWNRTAGGQEVPVVIGVDARSAAPGLRVTHLASTPVTRIEVYGPYLGGLQVRRAVSGLHRLHPLGYTGQRLSAAERELAGRRGVTAHDREGFVEALVAVLRREPNAVREALLALTELRQDAATREAFELAARIQEELQGLDWVTSPQRVTTLSAADLEVCGFADGLLVRFTIRSGRLDGWSTSRCPRVQAERELAATPEDWRDFARQNAVLAAALAGLGGAVH